MQSGNADNFKKNIRKYTKGFFTVMLDPLPVLTVYH